MPENPSIESRKPRREIVFPSIRALHVLVAPNQTQSPRRPRHPLDFSGTALFQFCRQIIDIICIAEPRVYECLTMDLV